MAKHGVSWEMHLRNILSETSIKKKKDQCFSLSLYVNVVIYRYYYPLFRDLRSL